MLTNAALEDTLNNVNSQLRNLTTQLTNTNVQLVLAIRELYAPITLPWNILLTQLSILLL